MEGAHGGDEAYGFVVLLGLIDGCGEGSYGSDGLHDMLGVFRFSD